MKTALKIISIKFIYIDIKADNIEIILKKGMNIEPYNKSRNELIKKIG
jgi:hypothetical protein